MVINNNDDMIVINRTNSDYYSNMNEVEDSSPLHILSTI